jgi:hypothetical protein
MGVVSRYNNTACSAATRMQYWRSFRLIKFNKDGVDYFQMYDRICRDRLN